MSSPFKTKHALRLHFTQQITSFSPSQLLLESQFIIKHLSSLDCIKKASTIALYAATQREIPLDYLHELFPSKRLLYPLCRPKNTLSLHLINHPSELQPSLYNILSPQRDIHPQVPVKEVDCFLCPGLAFDPWGTRLGHGGGYYDRLLAQASPKSTLLGIGLDCQCAPFRLPKEPYDVPLHGIISPKRGFFWASQ